MENKITGLSPRKITDENEAVDLSDNLPTQALCEQIDLLTAEAREGLLYKALTVSNAKCNKLVSGQNARIEELTRQVKNVRLSVNELEWNQKEENESLLGKMRQQSENMQTSIKENVREMKDLTAQIQTEVRTVTAKVTDEAAKVLTKRINDMADGVIEKVNGSTIAITEKVKAAEQEIARVKDDIHYERGFRKFFFWATPILLLVQTAVSVFLLLR